MADTAHVARRWRNFHGIATLVWAALIVPSLLWWRQSVPWLVFMSVWANVGTHFSAYQAARSEVTGAENP